MTVDDKNGDWDEYRRLVMHELGRLEERIAEDFVTHTRNDERMMDELNGTLMSLSKSISSLREDVAAIKVKSGVWGLIGGAIPATVTLILLYLESKQP